MKRLPILLGILAVVGVSSLGGCVAEWVVDRRIDAADVRWQEENDAIQASVLEVNQTLELHQVEAKHKIEQLGFQMQATSARQTRELESLQKQKSQASMLDAVLLTVLGTATGLPVGVLATARNYRKRWQTDKRNTVGNVVAAFDNARTDHPDAEDWWKGKGGEAVKAFLSTVSPEIQAEIERQRLLKSPSVGKTVEFKGA